MRVLVTGAFGFVGLNVVRRLAGDGHSVVAAGRGEPDEWVRTFVTGFEDRVTFRAADIAVPGALAQAVRNDALDAVVHAAVVTATTLDVEREAARAIVDVNTGGTVDALNVAVEHECRRFVYVSSPAAIGGDAIGVIDEEILTEPSTIYGITKRASEDLVRRYGALHGLSAASVRIAQPYGPGERPTSSRVRTSPIYEWIESAARGERLVTGPFDVARDWTYIDDTARGIELLTTADVLDHDLFHLGVGHLASVGAVVELLRERYPGIEVDDKPEPDGLNPNIANTQPRVLSQQRFRQTFGWAPSTPVDAGMRSYLEWRDGGSTK